MNNLDTSFWISFITITSALIGLALKYCFESKCDEISCFCVKIHRNVKEELKGNEDHA